MIKSDKTLLELFWWVVVEPGEDNRENRCEVLLKSGTAEIISKIQSDTLTTYTSHDVIIASRTSKP
jgi:hypothetical protein